jgi:hypothetical protein
MCVSQRIGMCFLGAMTALLLTGCPASGPTSTGPGPAGGAATSGGDHGHGHEGPHGGQLIELGSDEKYHAELVHDDASGTVTVYLLDGEAKAAAPIDAAEVTLNLVVDGEPKQFKLPASAMDDDPEGRSSRFELTDSELLEALEGGAEGRLSVEIDGTQRQGNLEHHEHEHEGEGEHEHEHDHEGEGAHDHEHEGEGAHEEPASY